MPQRAFSKRRRVSIASRSSSGDRSIRLGPAVLHHSRAVGADTQRRARTRGSACTHHGTRVSTTAPISFVKEAGMRQGLSRCRAPATIAASTTPGAKLMGTGLRVLWPPPVAVLTPCRRTGSPLSSIKHSNRRFHELKCSTIVKPAHSSFASSHPRGCHLKLAAYGVRPLTSCGLSGSAHVPREGGGGGNTPCTPTDLSANRQRRTSRVNRQASANEGG